MSWLGACLGKDGGALRLPVSVISVFAMSDFNFSR